MAGLYLYCVRLRSRVVPEVQRNISGKGSVYAVAYKDIEAVVSEVDMGEFSSKEITEKVQDDLQWIKEKAELHEYVVESMMKQGATVIPMKFGTIFQGQSTLEKMLAKRYEEFKSKLDSLGGKQEWAAKVYLDHKTLEQEVRETNPRVRQKVKEFGIESQPEGVAYFMEKQLDEIVFNETAGVLAYYQSMFLEKLTCCAEACAKGKLLEKELTGKKFPMMLNTALLLRKAQAPLFKAEVQTLQQEFEGKGFHFEWSGPWPPYNFV